MKTVIKCTDGSVAVMTLVEGADLDEALRKWGDVNPGKYLSHRDMENSAIPKDREFREAWTDTTPEAVIDIDMVKARKIHLDRIRVKRNAALDVLDIEALKAIEKSDTVTLTAVAAKKQALRDLPQTMAADLEAAKTVDDLKKIIPL
jgi:hypothetical protein